MRVFKGLQATERMTIWEEELELECPPTERPVVSTPLLDIGRLGFDPQSVLSSEETWCKRATRRMSGFKPLNTSMVAPRTQYGLRLVVVSRLL